MTPGLTLSFTRSPAVVTDIGALKLRAVFTNASQAPIRLYAPLLPFATLYMEGRTENLRPILPGSPPFPPEDDGSGRIELAPGESAAFDYLGMEFFQPPLALGKYEVRFRYANRVDKGGEWTGILESPWLPFEVVRRSAS